MMNILMRGSDETLEKRMRLMGFAQKFGMKLTRKEERMVFQFDDFNQLSIWGLAAQDETGFLEFIAIGVVEFVAVTMAFVDDK